MSPAAGDDPASADLPPSQPEVDAPTPAPQEADPQLERDYQAALERLRKPSRLAPGLLLIGSLVAFLLVQRGRGDSSRSVLILVAVVLFHELGHFAGMRYFGYRDIRMFFIPFFGAAVSGKRSGVAAWKEGVVLLLGPVPGIVVGSALALSQAALSSTAWELGLSLLTINAFNLLPLAGLDGARLLQLVLFSRRRWLEMGFQGCAAAGSVALAVSWHSVALGVLAYLMLIVLPYRWRLLGAAERLRGAALRLPTDAAALDGDAGRALFREAREAVGEQGRNRPAQVAAAMEQLLDAAVAERPSMIASLALGVGLLLAFSLAVVATVSLVQSRPF